MIGAEVQSSLSRIVVRDGKRILQQRVLVSVVSGYREEWRDVAEIKTRVEHGIQSGTEGSLYKG